MTVKMGVKTILGQNKNICNDQVRFAANDIVFFKNKLNCLLTFDDEGCLQ